MKNFKLLLATTAILSAGALMANATDSIPGDTASVGVNAELVEVRAIKKVSDLSFGRTAFMEYTGEYPISTLSIEIDEDGLTRVEEIGTIDGDGDAEAYVLAQGTRGVVKGATCAELDYPGKDDDGSVSIAMDTIPTGAGASDGRLTYLNCETVNNTSVFDGMFTAEPSNENGIVPGTYSGSFTVTLITNP